MKSRTRIVFCTSNVYKSAYRKVIQSYPSFSVTEYGWAYFSFVVYKTFK